MTTSLALIPMSYQNHPLRVEKDAYGAPLFHVGDLCAILGHLNPRQAVRRHVDDDDVTKRDVIDSLGRTQLANFVSEPGMWALILGSETQAAKPVKRWMTAEVLPSIRKTGSYNMPGAISSSQSLDFIAERLERIERAVSALAPAAALSLPPAATKNLGSAECLDLILASEVPVTGEQWRGDASALELIGVVCGRPSRNIPERDAVRTLARYGLRIDDGMLLISNTNKQLRQLLARTRWAGAWRLALSGIAGARKIPKTVFIGGHGSWCVAVPIPSGGGDGSG